MQIRNVKQRKSSPLMGEDIGEGEIRGSQGEELPLIILNQQVTEQGEVILHRGLLK